MVRFGVFSSYSWGGVSAYGERVDILSVPTDAFGIRDLD
jgi:hypothetical protein